MLKVICARTKDTRDIKKKTTLGRIQRGGARGAGSGEVRETRITKTSYFAKNSHKTYADLF